MLYDNVKRTVLQSTACVATTVVIAAKTGPAHGVHNNPRAIPKTTPPKNPLLPWIFRPMFATGLVILANKSDKRGKIMTKPKKKISVIAAYRRKLDDSPVAWTIAVNASVKKVKLQTSPAMMPRGRNLPCVVPADKIAGRIGKIQGDRTVAIPAKKANANKMSIEPHLTAGR
jgi:hypothetical protein